MKRTTQRTLLAMACLVAATAACAQSTERYPTRPVRMIIPFATGGAEVVTSRSPEEFTTFLRTQNEFWAKLVKQTGAVAE